MRAASIAHDLRNPLAYVQSNLTFALERLRDGRERDGDPELLAALQEALRGIEDLHQITRDLGCQVRGDGPLVGADHRLHRIDVNAVLESSLKVAWNQLSRRALVSVDLGDVPPVIASEHQLGRVFLNLLLNAGQAIPGGAADRHRIAVRTARQIGGVVVSIEDTGCGIAPEMLDRIFEPLFTTKTGSGTGLGLAICRDIVTALGGSIRVRSQLGCGTSFTVALPAR